MTFYLLPFICIGLYAGIKYGLIPVFEKMQPISISKQILKEVILSSAHTLNSLVLLAALVYTVLSIFFSVIRLLAGVGSVGLAEGLLGIFGRISNILTDLDNYPAYKYLGVGVLLLAFCAALYRSYKKQYSDQFNRKAAELAEGFSSGRLAYTEIPPNADMQLIQERIQACTDYLNQLTEAYQQEPSAELANRIKEGEELLGLYTQAWYRSDVFRRVRLDTITTVQSSLKDDVLVFFSSKGWVNTITNVTGTFSKLALVCVMVSLITVQTLQGSRVMADQLSDTYLTKTLDEARSSFEKTISEHTGSRAITVEDELVLDEMAADYELLFANSLFEKLSANDTAAMARQGERFKMQSLVVRQQILNAFVKLAANRSNSPGFSTQADLADSSLFTLTTPEEKTNWQFIQAYTRIESRNARASAPAVAANRSFHRKPKTAIGLDFRARMRKDFASKSEVLWSRAKRNFAAYKASFHEPIGLHDLRGRLFTETVGKIIEKDLTVTGDQSIDDLMKAFVDDVREDLLEKAHAKMSYKFMDMTARGETYENVTSHFSEFNPEEVFGGSHRVETMRASMPTMPTGTADAIAGHHPPSLNANVKNVNMAEAEQALKNLNGGTISERSTAALNSYEDFFPGQIGSESRTSAGLLRQSVAPAAEASERLMLASADDAVRTAGEVIETGLSRIGSSFSRAEASFIRSRSYIRLRGFSRIGGVLIGNEPGNASASANETGADFVDLHWQAAHDKLTLSLINRDKSEIQIGTYPKSIVQQALAYAADGRLTTVTMVSVPPVAQLKVLLHPALVNSQLGLTAMELDRLVDSFQSPEIGKARQQVMIWGMLYSTAYLERTLARFSEQTLSDEERPKIEQLRQSQQAKWAELAKYWSIFRSVLPGDQPEHYPFQEKAAYFDADLLRTIQQVIKTSADFNAFRKNLINTFVANPGSGRAPFASEFQVWSGVREQSYKVDKHLSFLQNNPRNPYYPLDFMVQVAFTSMSKPDATDESTDQTDPDPWQFPALTAKNAVNLAVTQGINRSPKYHQVLSDMQQFTQLQRVFRLAFRGQLGYDFPLDKLLNLLAVTTGSVPREETPEWNLNPSAYVADLAFGRESSDFASLVRALGVYRRPEKK